MENDLHRPLDTQPFHHDTVLRDSDFLETTQSNGHDLPDSPSSAADAGLIDVLNDFDSSLDSEFDEGLPPEEIAFSDLEQDAPTLHMPEMSDMDAPGEIDIEELDERAVEALLPPEARLDPLED